MESSTIPIESEVSGAASSPRLFLGMSPKGIVVRQVVISARIY